MSGGNAVKICCGRVVLRGGRGFLEPCATGGTDSAQSEFDGVGPQVPKTKEKRCRASGPSAWMSAL
jgi:hypothetical protein